MPEQYRPPELKAYYGLVPESISHEGYSAKPMHSYWDNCFVLRGLKDAAAIARIVGESAQEAEYAALVREFRSNVSTSIRLAMEANNIDFIPGCVELGDFDATSTAIGISPGGELEYLPREAVERTFERYYEHFKKRRDSSFSWNAYTPYEIKVCGTFLHLVKKDRTHEMLNYFLSDQRPQAWNHWAEVVWRDRDTPAMIGDMPHTWVGSDYLSVFRSLFAYERERDTALVIGMGILEAWVDSEGGVKVNELPTPYGKLSYAMRGKRGGDVVITFEKGESFYPRKLVIISPRSRPIRRVVADGKLMRNDDAGSVTLERIPKEIVLEY